MSSQIFNGRSAGTILNPHFFYKQIVVDGSKTNWLLCIMEGPRFEGLPESKGLAKSNSLKLRLENPGRPKNGFLPPPTWWTSWFQESYKMEGTCLFCETEKPDTFHFTRFLKFETWSSRHSILRDALKYTSEFKQVIIWTQLDCKMNILLDYIGLKIHET
jgi:hypothetical protein